MSMEQKCQHLHFLVVVQMTIKWTKEMDDFLIDFVTCHSQKETLDELYDRFGVRISVPSLKARKNKLGIKCGINTGRFQKGNVPFNKGLKISEYMSAKSIERTKATRFKSGELHGRSKRNKREVGSIKTAKDGTVLIKTNEKRESGAYKFIPFARYVWEQHNGKIPEGFVIRHADGNKLNNDISNLRLVSQAQNVILQSKKYKNILNEDTFDSVAMIAEASIKANKLANRKKARCGSNE